MLKLAMGWDGMHQTQKKKFLVHQQGATCAEIGFRTYGMHQTQKKKFLVHQQGATCAEIGFRTYGMHQTQKKIPGAPAGGHMC